MITFIIENKNNEFFTIECSLEDSILSLKNKIIEHFKLSRQYIDINFILKKPIRSLGKFNLESGILPRSLDKYTFDRYELDNKNINATFNEVHDYDDKKYDRKFKHRPSSELKKNKVLHKFNLFENNDNVSIFDNESSFDIDSIDDFPSLGS